MTTMTDSVIKKDRLRFTKNKLSANLALLGIVFNAIYFVDIYRTDVGNYYYSWLIGVSVLYNLVFMLAAFLCSEGVKNYKLPYSFVLMLIGCLEIVRIFILPVSAHSTDSPAVTKEQLEALAAKGEAIPKVMENFQFIFCTCCLIAAGVCCIIAGIIAAIKTTTLTNYQAELERSSRGSKV